MEGLQVLTIQGVHDKLSELAPAADLPWVLIKAKVFEFVDLVRSQGVFFVFSDDSETINKLQEKLQSGMTWEVTLPAGVMTILCCKDAQAALVVLGKKAMGALWPLAEPHVIKFLNVLYAYNCFVATTDDPGTKFLAEKTKDKPVCIRVKGEV